MAFYDEIDGAWKNHETYSAENIASLMAGVDPNNVVFDPKTEHFRCAESGAINTDDINRVAGCFKKLKSAIEDNKLTADIIHSARLCNNNDKPDGNEGIISKYEWFNSDNNNIGKQDVIYSTPADWSKTKIRRDHITAWLKDIKYNDMFFYPDHGKSEDKYWDILDPKGNHFASRLAALIRAYREVHDPNSKYFFEKHKTPKQAIAACLEENKESWFLVDEDGKTPSAGTIQKWAALAGWDKKPGRRSEK